MAKSKKTKKPLALDDNANASSNSPSTANDDDSIELINYRDETQIADIMSMIGKELSEPYSIYTYRYFLNRWPQLCFIVRSFSHLSFNYQSLYIRAVNLKGRAE